MDSGSSERDGSPVIVERPTYIPERKPQPLARNFDQKLGQLRVIAQNPTENQINQVTNWRSSQDPQHPEVARDLAENDFESLKTLLEAEEQTKTDIQRLRREAIGAKDRIEFVQKKAEIDLLKSRRQLIREELAEMSGQFKEAGVQVESEQLPLGVSEKAQQLAGKVAAGVGVVGHGIKSGTEAVVSGLGMAAETNIEGFKSGAQALGGEIQTGKEAVLGLGQEAIRLGRRSVKSAVETSSNFLGSAREGAKSSFVQLRSMIETQASTTSQKATSKISNMVGRLTGFGEKIAEPIINTWEAGGVWVNQRKQDLEKGVVNLQTGAQELINSFKLGAAERVDSFRERMKNVGERAKASWDSTSQAVVTFTNEQSNRVVQLEQEIRGRIANEVSLAYGKAKIILEPAWESIQKDRERVRDQTSLLHQKLGVVVEHVSDLASPLVAQVLDQGRDIRDGVVGLARPQIEGMRIFGGNISRKTGQITTPAWEFLADRFEDLRVRANVSRDNLNAFLSEKLGPSGARLLKLPENAAAGAERAKNLLNGVVFQGGEVLQNGVAVSKDIEAWFAHQAATAGVVFQESKVFIEKGMTALGRYWEIYAVDKWKDAGLSDGDIKKRLKVLRAVGAASLGRAAQVGSEKLGSGASLAAAGGIEGLILAQRLVRDPRGRLLLVGAAAIAYALATNPELAGHIHDSVMNGLSNLPIPAEGFDFSSPLGASPAVPELPSLSPPDYSSNTDLGLVPDQPLLGQESASPVTDTSLPETNEPMNNTGGVADIGSAPSPEAATDTLVSNLTPGQPIESQIRQIPGTLGPDGSPTDKYYDLLRGAFDKFGQNFETTSQAVINDPLKYNSQQVQSAQEALDAISQIKDNPSLNPRADYSIFMKAMHYWRPS